MEFGIQTRVNLYGMITVLRCDVSEWCPVWEGRVMMGKYIEGFSVTLGSRKNIRL